MPKLPVLSVTVALASLGCSTPECVRVILPGEAVLLRRAPDSLAHDPLCPVCAAAVLEDAKLAVRLFLHREEQEAAKQRILDAGNG